MIRDVFEASIKNITRQKLRSLLTLSGVIIGITAIVCLMSIGAGLTNSVNEQFEQLGTNIVYMLGSNPMHTLSEPVEFSNEDISWGEGVIGVDYIMPLYLGNGLMEAGKEKKNITIMSMDLSKAQLFEKFGYFEVEEGKSIEENDSQGVLVSNKLAREEFDKELNTKKLVTINNQSFRIIGIQKKVDAVLGNQNTDNMVLLSKNAFSRLYPNPKPAYLMIITESRENNSQVADEFTDHFEDKYGKKSIYVYTSDQLIEQINTIYGVITFFLVGISAISMIVGGVGIMNAMITSVMEKVKEIGVMKAIGASNQTILLLFIFEAALIGLIGEILGTILGYILAQIISLVAIESGILLSGVINLEITLIGLSFSTIVGVISGYFPAKQAAELDPIESLRFE